MITLSQDLDWNSKQNIPPFKMYKKEIFKADLNWFMSDVFLMLVGR